MTGGRDKNLGGCCTEGEGPSPVGTIGVVIPTYNRVAFLAKAVDSALAQSRPDLEILIMDNRSEDGTPVYASALTDGRVRYVRNEENVGLARNIDRGISLFSSRVAWCTVLCDDDFLDPGFLESAAWDILTAGARSIVLGHTRLVNRDGKVLRESQAVPAEEKALEYLKNRSMFQRDRYLSGIVFSRTHYVENGGYPKFRTGMATDDALVFALALRDRVVHSRGAIAYVRIHPEAESQDRRDIRMHLESLRQYGEYCSEKFSETPGNDPGDPGRLAYYLRRHITELGSGMWLDALNTAFGAPGDDFDKGTAETLMSLAAGGEFPFTARVRTTARIFRSTGICPEKYRSYRRFWRIAKRLSGHIERFLRKQ